MPRLLIYLLLIVLSVFLISRFNQADYLKGFHLEKIKLPPGFSIALYANHVPNARSMVLSPAGTLFVGTRNGGDVYALPDMNRDHRADEVIRVLKGLKTPNGVAFSNGALYVAEVGRVLRYDNIEAQLPNPPRPVVVNESFPTDTHHGWKYIALGPDGLLYVPVGAPCNVCEKQDERYASIMRMKLDGSELEVFARGVRNTVGFDWHPETGDLWFTDNGADWLGDDRPPDELNRAPKKGLHFGYPYCHGWRPTRSAVREGKGLRRLFLSSAQAWSPCSGFGNEILHRKNVSRRISASDIYCRTRLLEPL